MLVIQHKRRRVNQLTGSGSGFIDTAAKFLTTHKDKITNLADVVGSVAKASSASATAAKQIYDVIKSKKRNSAINKMLSDKSNDILARLSDVP